MTAGAYSFREVVDLITLRSIIKGAPFPISIRDNIPGQNLLILDFAKADHCDEWREFFGVRGHRASPPLWAWGWHGWTVGMFAPDLMEIKTTGRAPYAAEPTPDRIGDSVTVTGTEVAVWNNPAGVADITVWNGAQDGLIHDLCNDPTVEAALIEANVCIRPTISCRPCPKGYDHLGQCEPETVAAIVEYADGSPTSTYPAGTAAGTATHLRRIPQ